MPSSSPPSPSPIAPSAQRRSSSAQLPTWFVIDFKVKRFSYQNENGDSIHDVSNTKIRFSKPFGDFQIDGPLRKSSILEPSQSSPALLGR
jgi:hypothetical protein